MIRLIFWFAVLVAVTFGVTWLADSPGAVSIVVRGYRIETQSIGLAILAIALLFFAIWVGWGLLKWILGRPSAFGGFFARRRQRKGRDALSTGLVAIGAGDEAAARKAAIVASRMLPNDPLAQLLAAQSAQQQGDSSKVKQVYKEMTKADDTKLLGMRGLFNEARKEKNIEAARQIARDALAENPGVSWASNAMLVSYAAENDWPAVLQLLDNQEKAKIIDKETAKAKKAVALTAQAMAAEDKDPETAISLATRAHKLDPSLVPAAIVAARALATTGAIRKASKTLEKTWKIIAHPDIAEVYAHIRPGDSVQDRLIKVQNLTRIAHGGMEGAIAMTVAAIDAQDWKTARESLNSYINDQPSVRVCTLMAEIEAGEFGDKGKTREWLARAVTAKRDPAWTASGFVSPEWKPISPINGELGAFEWKVPVQGLGYSEGGRNDTISPTVIAQPIEVVEEVKTEPEPEMITIKAEETKTDLDKVSAEEISDNKAEEKASKASSDTEKAGDKDKQEEKPAKAVAEQQAKPKLEKQEKPEPEKTAEKTSNAENAFSRLPDDPGPKKKTDGKPGESWFG